MRFGYSSAHLLGRVLLLACLWPAGIAHAQVVMTPPARSVEVDVEGMTFSLTDGSARDEGRITRLFGDTKDMPETRVVQNPLQLLPQAGLSWTASEPMVSLSVAKYYLALGDEVRVPLYMLTNLPATGNAGVDNAVTNVLNEFGGLLNLALGFENTRITIGKLFAFADPNEGVFFEGRLGMKLLGIPGGEAAENSHAVMGQALASLRANLPIFASDSISRAGEMTLLLSLSAQYCNAEAYRSLFVDPLSSFQTNLNISGAISIVRQLGVSGGLSLWASESQFDTHWFATITVLNE